MPDQEPVLGDEEEEEEVLDTSALGEEETLEGQAPPVEAPAEEEEMPDDLLTPAELAERTRERAERQPAPRESEPVDRSALTAELREIFSGLRQPAQPERAAPPAARPELQPFTLSEEKAAELTEKILSQQGGLAKALAWAVNEGDKRATARMAGSNEGQAAMQAAGASFADRFVARKLREPETRFGKAVEPIFQQMLEGFNLSDLASMAPDDRNEWLDGIWERATGRTLIQKATTKRPPSPGVARGAGSKPSGANRGRVVIRLSESEKKQVYATLPTTEEGRKRGARQIWEIEHGVTSDATVRRAVGDSMRFSDAVGFGG